MNEPTRPDPDALLAAVQKDETRQGRGKLKLFLGMAAGVGKTYAMLSAAQQRRSEGLDVVVAYAETHGRAETDALLEGLEVIPRRRLEYRSAWLEEMDTDAVLARRPALALVDELAHSNAPGSRHLKRYQDVVELLEAGLNVWTTVNVQHFESRADAVQQITGITIHETVPDSLLDMADEIELIDLSPEDLRKRLAEGKVYTLERADLAARNFFRVGNLTALREMALRLTAEHVDHQLQDYMQLKQIAGPWKSGERLMVAVGPSPFSERLIRWTRRMAYNLEAPWLAVTVSTPDPLSEAAKERLARNVALARSLGGEIVGVSGEDVPSALLRLARQRNVTQIVIGKPQHTRWQTLLRGGSLVDQVIRASGDIDIYVVTGDAEEGQEGSRPPLQQFFQRQNRSPLGQYGLALAFVVGLTALNLLLVDLLPWMTYLSVGLINLLMVLLVAVYLGRGPALMAASVSALSWNFLFIEPRFTFIITHVQDVILFAVYFAIAIFIGNLTSRLRQQERQARHAAERTLALYTLAHETATAVDMDSVLKTAITQIDRMFDAQVAFCLAQGEELAAQAHLCSTWPMDEKEISVARWAYLHGRPAGRFTDTLGQAQAQYRPLMTPSRTLGVIGLRPRQAGRFSPDQELLLETFISQIALVIEREVLDEVAQQSAMLRESERLYGVLLNSISHELRTPIATIKGASSGLLDPVTSASEATRRQLSQDIHSAADRLNRLVANLLDMSRLESGRLQLKRDWCDLADLIGVALQRLDAGGREHPIETHIAPQLPLLRLDFGLMEQVLLNLLDNACTYTPPGTRIHVEALAEAREVRLIVWDEGPGIPPALRERIFEKFYRLPGSATGGTGLGLSISRGLVEAHEGRLLAEEAPGGGARFVISLPRNGAPPPIQEAEHG